MATARTPDDDRGELTLVPPVRARLVELAAGVMAQLPPESLPATLRPIARFTPAKRARLGAPAIAAALDAEPAFREAVAEVVSASSPELVAGVGDRSRTAASDPVDVAVVAYLTRPSGWEGTVAAACAQWVHERAGADADGVREEVGRLRTELARLRADARGEDDRTRAAVATALEGSAAELAELRRTVRTRTGELRRAERDAQAARREAEDARAGLEIAIERARAQGGEDQQRLRARVTELEQSVEAARRVRRISHDVDDARLWLLTDTLVQAANGLRRELSLAAPELRPADGVVVAPTSGSARALRDVAALDRVLALPNVHLVVDGYNVTKTGYGQLPLIDQRERLIGSLAPLVAQTGAEVTIAFDGAARPPVQPAAPRGVRVLFSVPGEIADDLIRRLVAAEPLGRPVVVATSDKQVVSDTAADDAWSVPSAVLLTRLG